MLRSMQPPKKQHSHDFFFNLEKKKELIFTQNEEK
jgi:hypothetical protein